MDVEIFVNNLKSILDKRGISYSKAGRESGAGVDFIRMMDLRKSAPSYLKVQMMAQYLGMTTSELLGEKLDGSPFVEGDSKRLLSLFENLNPEGQERLLETADDMVRSGKYGKKGDQSEVGKKQA